MQYLSINFSFKRKKYKETINISEVSTNLYKDMWQWWFGNKDYDFELNGLKNKEGEVSMRKLKINVYPKNRDNAIMVINKINKTTIY